MQGGLDSVLIPICYDLQMGPRCLLILMAISCVRVARPVVWALPSGEPAVRLCDGGVIVEDEVPDGRAPAGPTPIVGFVPVSEAKECVRLMDAEIDHYWESRRLTFEFESNEDGLVVDVCALRVPAAPRAVTCAANALRRARASTAERGVYLFSFYAE